MVPEFGTTPFGCPSALLVVATVWAVHYHLLATDAKLLALTAATKFFCRSSSGNHFPPRTIPSRRKILSTLSKGLAFSSTISAMLPAVIVPASPEFPRKRAAFD